MGQAEIQAFVSHLGGGRKAAEPLCDRPLEQRVGLVPKLKPGRELCIEYVVPGHELFLDFGLGASVFERSSPTATPSSPGAALCVLALAHYARPDKILQPNLDLTYKN